MFSKEQTRPTVKDYCGAAMLIHFMVRNFRSIHSEQRLTFANLSDKSQAATHCMSTGCRSVPRVSKSAIIFGPNGSGKTNLFSALSVMRDLVLRSTTLSLDELRARHTPFLLDHSANLPTAFEVDLIIEGIRYIYSFSYDSTRIVAERLLVSMGSKSQRWFDRTVSGVNAGRKLLIYGA